MLRPRVVPLLLVQAGALVKTTQFRNPRYIGDPLNATTIFNSKGVDELIIICIDASKGGKINASLLKDVAALCAIPLVYGGGVKTIDEMRVIYSLGFEKIIVNTAAHNDFSFIEEAAGVFGSQAVMVGVDVRLSEEDGLPHIYTDRGKRLVSKKFEKTLQDIQSAGAGEIFLQFIEGDGMWTGLDNNMIRRAASLLSIPLTVAGGTNSLEAVQEAIFSGASAVALGSMAVFQKKNGGVLINFPPRYSREQFSGVMR